MASDWINIGPTPPGEDCAMVDEPDYTERATRECRAYIGQLRRHYGTEPAGARLRVLWQPHDLGMYAEVVCDYDPSLPAAVEYAYRCEEGGPENWDPTAREELGLQ